MFERLAEEVDALSVPLDGAAIAAAVSLRDRLDAKISEAVGAFDAAALWDVDAATSMTAWLREHASMTRRDAARTTEVAKRVRQLPVLAEAWQNGDLSTGQVHTVVGGLDDNTVGIFADHEAAVVPALVGLSVNDTSRAMSTWKARADALSDQREAVERERSLHLSSILGRTWVLDGRFDATSGEVVSTALRLAASEDTEAEPTRSPAERRADALVDVCRFFLDHHDQIPGRRQRPHLNVVVDLEELQHSRGGRTLDGELLDGPEIAALLCDSVLHRLVASGRSIILDYGSATRTVPAPLWNALVVRDEHCRFPGCDRKVSWCEAHHVVHVADDGPTCMANLVLLCSRHHHRLHQPGWHAKLLPDATFELTDPDGRQRTTVSPRAGPRLC